MQKVVGSSPIIRSLTNVSKAAYGAVGFTWKNAS
jgi:hypothetical protein